MACRRAASWGLPEIFVEIGLGAGSDVVVAVDVADGEPEVLDVLASPDVVERDPFVPLSGRPLREPGPWSVPRLETRVVDGENGFWLPALLGRLDVVGR